MATDKHRTDILFLENLVRRWLDELPLRRRVIDLVRARGVRAYLVGGTVRDILLDRLSCDMDLAVEGEAMCLARYLADALRAAYVALDDDRDVGRVVVGTGQDQQHVDLARLREADIEGDLRARDFTINAMALDLERPSALLDPTGGLDDLRAGVLRVAREDAFQQDPLRTLRAVRLRATLGFALDPQTEALARAWLPALERVSVERIRDELAFTLASERAADALAYLGALGGCALVLPELALSDPYLARAARALAALESFIAHPPPLLRGYELERTYGVAFRLAVLFAGASQGAEVVHSAARRLHLSTREADFACACVAAGLQLRDQGDRPPPAPLEIYHYYRAWGKAGVEGAVLALVLAQALDDRPTAPLEGRVERLWRAWRDEYGALVDPPPLISGHEAMRALHLQPGPRLGRLLEEVREAQVQGIVRTPQEAIAYLRARA